MATLQVRIENLATRIGSDVKTLRTMLNGNFSDLAGLNTTAKTNIVAALNELKASIDVLVAAGYVTIDDALSSSTTKTWSITKISEQITAAVNAVLDNAPAAMNTLDELAAALGDDANFAASVNTALGNRVRIDTATQGLSDTQKSNARANIDAAKASDIGNTDTDFVAVFNTAAS